MLQRTRFLSALLLSALAVACGGGGGGSSDDGGGGGGGGGTGNATITNPVLFVTQVPTPDIFRTVTSTFASHEGRTKSAPRGGDLMIRYPDGSLRNLTEEAGYGIAGVMQVGANAIAVREPSVHWSGIRAVFSMVVGAPASAGDTTTFFWQLYEATGLAQGQTATITRVAGQPQNYNNVSPCYGSDGRILFTSDRPRSGAPHLYPQLDEYEETPTNTGLWSLEPGNPSSLFLVQHSPSGSFRPFVDSFGRVVYGRWDHLERDQQKDQENTSAYNGGNVVYGTFNYSDESASAFDTGSNEEVFPEARTPWVYFVENNPGYSGDLNGYQPDIVGNDFNLFFPWTINQDGTREETLNHIGRHELRGFVDRSIKTDPNVVGQGAPPLALNRDFVQNVMHIREDPASPGNYYAVDAQEFFTHSGGQIIRIAGAPSMNANQMTVTYVTHRDTQSPTSNPSPQHTGLYRNPLPLSDGKLIASHTAETRSNIDAPQSILHDYRLKLLEQSGAHWEATDTLTTGIQKSVQYFADFQSVSYTGELFELDPAEVVARPVPPLSAAGALEAPEAQVLADESVTLGALQAWLASQDLALVISRDVTTRDGNDKQQPYNLAVPGGAQTDGGTGGLMYDVEYLRFFQGDQIRGLTGGGTQPIPGRRVLAQEMHDPEALAYNPPSTGGPGSVEIAADGSVAALVPARRALSWQMEDPGEEPVVRERFWVTFQPGEVRTCASCHGINDGSQSGGGEPQNQPEALRNLLQYLKGQGEL